ncbi:MAG: outer membrane protein assembly factor BamD [Xanthobacteraceae bacterium]
MMLWRGSQRPDSRLCALGCCLALTLLAASLAGCSKDEDYVPDRPADALYNEGLYLLNNKQDYKEAAKKFDAVDRENPYSDWARKALLMSAYAYYQAEDYESCVNSAKRYIALHPGSADAAYAQYLIGASYYDQIVDVSRDQSRADKAIDALQEVVRKYPNSEYAIQAKKKIDMARDQLAGKEMDIGRYYMKNRDFIGAINRFKVVVTQYQTTRHVEEALERLSEAYIALGITDEAQTAAAVLGHNFPESPWYKDAYNLVKNNNGQEPAENKQSWISRAFSPTPTALKPGAPAPAAPTAAAPMAPPPVAPRPMAPGAPISAVPPAADKG